MKELNMAIYTSPDADKDNKVTLTASFTTHAEAVSFHDGLARLCRDHSMPMSEKTIAGYLSDWRKLNR